jgi:hypothetical protein
MTLEGWLDKTHYEIGIYEEYNRTAMSVKISKHGLPAGGFHVRERRKIPDMVITEEWKVLMEEAYDFYEKLLDAEGVKERRRLT